MSIPFKTNFNDVSNEAKTILTDLKFTTDILDYLEKDFSSIKKLFVCVKGTKSIPKSGVIVLTYELSYGDGYNVIYAEEFAKFKNEDALKKFSWILGLKL